MSPTVAILNDPERCFPRVSGDEPHDRWNRQAWTTFSPRERG